MDKIIKSVATYMPTSKYIAFHLLNCFSCSVINKHRSFCIQAPHCFVSWYVLTYALRKFYSIKHNELMLNFTHSNITSLENSVIVFVLHPQLLNTVYTLISSMGSTNQSTFIISAKNQYILEVPKNMRFVFVDSTANVDLSRVLSSHVPIFTICDESGFEIVNNDNYVSLLKIFVSASSKMLEMQYDKSSMSSNRFNFFSINFSSKYSTFLTDNRRKITNEFNRLCVLDNISARRSTCNFLALNYCDVNNKKSIRVFANPSHSYVCGICTQKSLVWDIYCGDMLAEHFVSMQCGNGIICRSCFERFFIRDSLDNMTIVDGLSNVVQENHVHKKYNSLNCVFCKCGECVIDTIRVLNSRRGTLCFEKVFLCNRKTLIVVEGQANHNVAFKQAYCVISKLREKQIEIKKLVSSITGDKKWSDIKLNWSAHGLEEYDRNSIIVSSTSGMPKNGLSCIYTSNVENFIFLFNGKRSSKNFEEQAIALVYSQSHYMNKLNNEGEARIFSKYMFMNIESFLSF